jgi:D-3-phosphoglycerate dehydrogenase / 2-oxoglutarate reductase
MHAVVLVTDHPFGGGLGPEREVLDRLGVELHVADGPEPERLIELAATGIDGILACYASVPAAVIDAAAAAGCRIVSRYGIGYDNIDIAAATRAGVIVTTVPDYCLDEVADHTLALLLSAARGIDQTSRAVRAGGWGQPERSVHRLAGRRLALVGLGAIGRRVASRARAFDLEITVFDPYAARPDGADLTWADTLEEAFGDADFISLHAPLTDATRHIVDATSLAFAQRSPILINTSRGGLVDLEAVTEALDSGALAAVALDVTEPEPLPDDHPLRADRRAIITAHTAFYSEEAQLELQRRAAEEIARVVSGERPQHPRNPEVLDGCGLDSPTSGGGAHD